MFNCRMSAALDERPLVIFCILLIDLTIACHQGDKEQALTSCVVHNWETMTCSWSASKTGLKITYVGNFDCCCYGGLRASCPNSHENGTNTCTWNDEASDYDYDNTLHDNYMYCISLVSDNDDSKIHSCLRFNSSERVKPNPVSQLKVSTTGPRTANVSWTMPKKNGEYRGKELRCQIRTQVSRLINTDEPKTTLIDFVFNDFQDNPVDSGRIIMKLDDGVRYPLTDLQPYTWYAVSVQCIPLLGINYAGGFWSDISSAEFRTAEDVPAMAPEITAGAFISKQKGDQRHVTIYWQPVPEKHRHGNIVSTRISCRALVSDNTTTNQSSIVTVVNSNDSFSGELALEPNIDYEITVESATSIGFNSSLHPNPIVLLGKYEPASPTDFVVTYNGLDAYATWTPVANAVRYTVYWCLPKFPFRRTCREPPQWAVVSDNSIRISLQRHSPDWYIFAVSAEENRDSLGLVSSGMTWASCVYDRNKAVPKPERVEVIPEEGCFIITLFKKVGCQTGYFSHYNIEYWKHNDDTSHGASRIRIKDSGNVDTRTKLCNVTAGVQYRFQITCSSFAGKSDIVLLSPESIPIEDYHRNLNDLWLMAISVTFAIGLLIICMFLIIRYYRRVLVPRFEIKIVPPEIPSLVLDYQSKFTDSFVDSGCSSAGYWTDSTSAGELSPRFGDCGTVFDFNENKTTFPDFNIAPIVPTANGRVGTLGVLPRIPSDSGCRFYMKKTDDSDFVKYSSNLVFECDDEEQDAIDEDNCQFTSQNETFRRIGESEIPADRLHATGSTGQLGSATVEQNYIQVLPDSDSQILDSSNGSDGINYVHDLVFDTDEESISISSMTSASSQQLLPNNPSHSSDSTKISDELECDELQSGSSYCLATMR